MDSMTNRPKTVAEFRTLAQSKLAHAHFNYYELYSEPGQTARDSEDAFQRYRFRPEILNDVSNRNLSTEVLGESISMPICAAATGAHCLAHVDGEMATAQGVREAGTLMIQSAFSNKTFADVARAAPGGLRWVQTYVFKEREVTRQLIARAEAAGYKAVVVTVDSPLTGFKAADQNREFKSFQHDEYRYRNMEVENSEAQATSRREGDRFLFVHFGEDMDSSVTWADIKWLKTLTSLPIVCKGILTGRAARQAADAGVSAVIVSAHGGRQLDGVPAPIDALSEVVEAVRGLGVEVYMDGGVRTGTDVLKALARGARAVFIGRPMLWGLACGGSDGVREVLEILRNELDYALGLCGCADVRDLPQDIVVHESYYKNQKSNL
ncbi:2-Hydroxyacid oxidase 1-like [Diadema antillarum]|uniref:2-Hydroxyacid oxidase 1-like n=1 Tax=Diadema antillarum TaxID=105358 RepID=UPI003A869CF0